MKSQVDLGMLSVMEKKRKVKDDSMVFGSGS